MGLFSAFDKATSAADAIGTDAHVNGDQSKSAVESMAKTIGKPLDEVRDMQAQEAAVKKTARDVAEAFGERIREQRDRATYGVDSETVDALRAMEGGEEVLGRMAERKARDREESTSKKNFEVGDDLLSNMPMKEERNQRLADVRSQFKYGVDADIADMIRGLDGGDELLGRMAERKDAAREAAADKIGDKLPAVSYARGTAVKPMLTASAGGASAAIGDALDAVQAGVSDMFDVAADFASERTASAKDALANVKDVATEAGNKAADTDMEL